MHGEEFTLTSPLADEEKVGKIFNIIFTLIK